MEKNHKLKRTEDFWKIIFKADEQALDRTIALLLEVWIPDKFWYPHVAWALIRNAESQAHPDILNQNLHFKQDPLAILICVKV